MKIEKLTKKQEKELIEFREKWRKIGISTERVDKEKTKEAIIKMYKLLGKSEPKFIFVPSPFFANLQINFCSKVVFPKMKEKIGDNLMDNLWDNLGVNLGDNLGVNLGGNLWANLRDNLGDNHLPEELKKFHNTYFWGQMDSYWIAFYKFPELKLGLKYAKEKSELLELWAKIANSSCWWWAFDNYVFVSDRPTKLNFNVNYRLHSDTQPAYEFSDGWNAYYLNGVKFPKDLWKKVVSKKMSFNEVIAIQDIDQRTQAMAYCPPQDFLREKGKLLDKSARGNELWLIPQSEGLFRIDAYFLYYKCPSSEKEYLSGIDPEIGKNGKADESMAWKFSITPFEYQNINQEA